MVQEVGEVEQIFQSGIDTIRLIAHSQHLPTSDDDLFAMGEYIDAYDANLVADHALYMQARAKARAYISQRLAERVQWNSGIDGAIRDMTEELREKLLRAMEPVDAKS
ncbi:MAG TPA: hypothetical protein VFM11_08040 [Burkholderiales bacterium]|nr:hypothetical protein [Burkholderiales bacterium]